MAYLVTHMAACLVFAQLLGLLLGWLFWGHVARQRGQELRLLRERPLDLSESRRISLAEPLPALADGAMELPGGLPSSAPDLALPPLSADLQTELQQERKKQFDKQARELESLRGLISSLQTDLSKAVEARRTAEQSLADTKNRLETRADGLQAQIRELEDAAQGWEEARRRFELDGFSKEKELSAARAQLRELLNSQQPLSADSAAPSPVETGDGSVRLDPVWTERDSLQAELDSLKASIAAHPVSASAVSEHMAELQDALREKEASLHDQAARVESLLWRVAELEPLAATAHRLEEDVKRREADIEKHLAAQAETAGRLRYSQDRLSALETELAEARQWMVKREAETAILSKSVTEARAAQVGNEHSHAAELQSLKLKLTNCEANLDSVRSSSAAKEIELAEHRSDVANHVKARADLEKRLAELQRKLTVLVDQEQLIVSRNNEIKALISATADTEREKQEWRQKTRELEQDLIKSRAEVDALIEARQREAERLTATEQALSETKIQLNRLPSLEKQVDAVRQAASVELQATKARHQADLQRLKIASSQRIRRLRQGITNFS